MLTLIRSHNCDLQDFTLMWHILKIYFQPLFPSLVQKHLEVIGFVHSIFDKLHPQRLGYCVGSLILVSAFGAAIIPEVRQPVWWLPNVSGCTTVIITSSQASPQNQTQNEEKSTLWRQWSHSSCKRFHRQLWSGNAGLKLSPSDTYLIICCLFLIQPGSEFVRIKTSFFRHLISFVRFLWFQPFLGSLRMSKIRTIMTKTRKEGIRCINRKISLLSSHFLLFVFLPAAAFTCRSQTRSSGQSSAKQQTGWLNEPNRCQQLSFWTSLMLFTVTSFY